MGFGLARADLPGICRSEAGSAGRFPAPKNAGRGPGSGRCGPNGEYFERAGRESRRPGRNERNRYPCRPQGFGGTP